MAQRKPPKKKVTPRRVSPLKPGLSGARNWANAHVRAASYSRKSMMRLIGTGVFVFLFILTGALWLGGFVPTLKATGTQFTKQRLMKMGFVVKYVDVVGEGRIAELQVRNALGVHEGDYLFDMDIENAQSRVQSLNWVDTAIVRRLWPNRIVVHINERVPYALWQDGGVFKLVDASGVQIEAANITEFNNLPLVVGAGAPEFAQVFLNIIATNATLHQRVQSVVYVNQRRWDIVLKDTGLRILLPTNNLEDALNRLGQYHEKYGVLDLELDCIDLRVDGRLILRPVQPDTKAPKRGKRA
ncbi:MAG: FtsQ-type POTRA domain-containing protein [Robiginitomaculum sp.]|nr:FtsQ-type POTRA domain-containing protein [Robiginitomaculum sp.]